MALQRIRRARFLSTGTNGGPGLALSLPTSAFGLAPVRLPIAGARSSSTPARVTTIIATHLHDDHVGGLVAFPNAQVVTTEVETSHDPAVWADVAARVWVA